MEGYISVLTRQSVFKYLVQEGINNEGKNWWYVEFTHNQLLPSGNSDELTYSRLIRSEKIPESTYSKFTRGNTSSAFALRQMWWIYWRFIRKRKRCCIFIRFASGQKLMVTPKIISHTFDFIFSLLLHYRVGRPLRNCPNFGNIFWYQHQNIINILDCFH